MRTVLSLLLSFVLIQSQAFALSGGPRYGGNSGSMVGTYSGVMVAEPTYDPNDPLGFYTQPVEGMGLFTVSVPETGLATGVITVFSDGNAFSGSFQGMGDSDAGTLKGVLDGNNGGTTITETRNVTVIDFSDTDERKDLSGSLSASVTDEESFYYVARISGKATTQVYSYAMVYTDTYNPVTGRYDWGAEHEGLLPKVNYVVDGVKQSSYANAASALAE